jgi:hypothetical protein
MNFLRQNFNQEKLMPMAILKKIIRPKDAHSTSGQGILEYIIISGLVGVFCLVAMKQFGQILSSRTAVIKKKIVEEMPVN